LVALLLLLLLDSQSRIHLGLLTISDPGKTESLRPKVGLVARL